MSLRLSLAEARRIAIAAQGLHQPRPTRVTHAHIRRVINRLGLLQLDFVNVLLPAHYMVLYSRLGQYRRQMLDDLVYRRREFTEHWAHEASIIPMSSWPLLRDRRETHRTRPYDFDMPAHQEYFDSALEQIRVRGALTAAEIDMATVSNRRAHEWYGTVSRILLEAHLGRGTVAVANRLPNFARSYDLVERIVPVELQESKVELQEAHRTLVLQAASAYGVATMRDLADYFRMPAMVVRPRLAELVESGRLKPVIVEGWREPAWLHADAAVPGGVKARTLLAPFDPLIWFRPRTLRLFEFEYRFEIFVPAEQRRWGCYVLPLLEGDRLVARVDVKADREGGRLLIPSAHLEPGADCEQTAAVLAVELQALARWLDLDAVVVGRKGRFALALRRSVARRS
jgi:uncharacterized protein YcaQ